MFRSIDLQEVIGGIGGYIGALLGYSILQIPELLILIMSKIKWIMKTMQINKNSNKKLNETQSKFLDTFGKKPHENSETYMDGKDLEKLRAYVLKSQDTQRDDIIERLKTLEESMEEVLKSTTKIHINDKTRILKTKDFR